MGSDRTILAAVTVLAAGTLIGLVATDAGAASTTTTAWHNGSFTVDTPGVTRRSNLVLKRANTSAGEFVPLGNGTLGAAAWAANGFTAQLNRTDTFPNRWSPGWVVTPGLSKLTSAADFSGYLDVYDGTPHESGGGMTPTAYIRADTAQLVVDVTGADPASTQNVTVVDGTGATVTTQTTGTFGISVQAGGSYLIQRTSAPTTSLPFAAVSGTAATTPKALNGRSIGLAK